MPGPLQLPLHITVRPSSRVVLGLYAGHLGAFLTLFLNGLPWPANGLIAVGLFCSLLQARSRFILLRHPQCVVRLVLGGSGEWWLTTAGGDTTAATLVPGAFVHPWLVVLTFRAEAGRYQVILTPEQVDPQTFRRLRVRLRFKLQGSSFNV